jgi:hypothetical protein
MSAAEHQHRFVDDVEPCRRSHGTVNLATILLQRPTGAPTRTARWTVASKDERSVRGAPRLRKALFQHPRSSTRM